MSERRRPSPRCRALFVELSKYLEGELTPARKRIVERHLRVCACCRTMEECLRKTIAACRTDDRTRLPRDVRSRAAARIRALLSATRR